MRPRLPQIAWLGLFIAGLALHSLHLGHDIFVDEHAECECVAIDRQESAVYLLPDVPGLPGTEVAASAATVAGFARDPNLYYAARAPPRA